MKTKDIERFKSKYQEQPNGCWEWMTKSKTHDGYGVMIVDGVMRSGHRLSYELFKGLIPEGLLVCHTCDNPSCVNPSHLFLGTAQDNMTDKVNKGRSPKGEKNASAKLTEEQIRSIKIELNDGGKVTHIAIKYGMSHGQVSKIKSGKKWGHI